MLIADQPRGRRRYWILVIAVALGAVVGIWQSRSARHGASNPLTGAARTLTLPFVNGTTAASRWFGRQFGWLMTGRGLADENARLRTELAAAREEAARLRGADVSLERLRSQLGFTQSSARRRMAADVVSLKPSPYYDTMVVSRGSRDGVRIGSVAVAPSGVVGAVYDVAPTSAAILMLTDRNASIGAIVERPSSRATGVCKGTGDGRISMAYLDRDADVRVGDLIVSSGLAGEAGIFPKGVVIGSVEQVGADTALSTRRVVVRPAVAFGRLEEVYLLP